MCQFLDPVIFTVYKFEFRPDDRMKFTQSIERRSLRSSSCQACLASTFYFIRL